MTITAQALGLAFPDVPGFKGQGWSTQETAVIVRWLFGNPSAWDQAMDTARAYPGNTHTVADTLHETIVPRTELDAIVTAGGDPARVNWLEVAHELIERRDDPEPAPVSLAARMDEARNAHGEWTKGSAGLPAPRPASVRAWMSTPTPKLRSYLAGNIGAQDRADIAQALERKTRKSTPKTAAEKFPLKADVSMHYVPGDGLYHKVEARTPDGKKIGSLEWSKANGDIHMVEVDKALRGKGVASAMLGHAQGLKGVGKPKHSANRTAAGIRWSDAVGGAGSARYRAQVVLSGGGEESWDEVAAVLDLAATEGITAQFDGPVSLAAQAAADAPDGPAAAMTTARHLHDTSRHLTAASGHLDAAREAPPADQDGHLGKCASSLDGAHASAHDLAAHLRDRYPAEGADLDALTETIGLARGYDLNPRSGWISLDLPPGTITPVPGGVNDHHVTVVYLGPDVDDEAFAQACDRARDAATAMPGPLAGTAGGIGTFPPSGSSDGQVPAWAGVVLPGAERVRAALEDLSASEHKDWKPHVTVAYVEPGEPLPAPVPQTPVVFTHLSVHRGDDEVARFPLGGGPAEMAGPGITSGQYAIGLAVSVSDQAKTATTAHLTQTICNHLGHTIAHVKAMGDDPEPKVREFNWQHGRTHLDGALEHAAKLAKHLQANYPEEGSRLAELKAGGTISAQAGGPASPKGYARPELAGTITSQLDLSARDGWRAESRDMHGRWTRAAGVATAARQSGGGKVGHDPSLVADAREASPEEFASAFGKAFAGSPFSAFVNHYSPAQIRAEHMTPVLAAGGKAGVLIHPHGDGRVEPTALFNTSGQRGMGLALGRLAIEKYGANYAECFGPALPKMYATLGYADGNVYPFDPAEAPPGWDTAKFDSPDYHTMNLATQGQQVIAAANEGDMDLDEIREQSGCTDEEWQAALAVFGIEPPASPPAEA